MMGERQLTGDAQADRDEFEHEIKEHGCTCFISPPCSYCLHPGNPLNQEDDSCWEPVQKNYAESNQGHGWVNPRPDGYKARCGGPGLCPTCAQEARKS